MRPSSLNKEYIYPRSNVDQWPRLSEGSSKGSDGYDELRFKWIDPRDETKDDQGSVIQRSRFTMIYNKDPTVDMQRVIG